MADGEALAWAFVEAHPWEAARTLEALPAPEVAAFLASLAPDRAGSVLTGMLPRHAADCLEALERPVAKRLAGFLEAVTVADIARCLPEDRCRELLGWLRPGRRAGAGLLLAYPQNTLGAWADPRAISLRRDATVAWARKAVRVAAAPPQGELLIVDEAGRLVGMVVLAALLRSDPEVRLGTILEPDRSALPARSDLSRAAEVFAGTDRRSLPVVDNRGRPLGVLSPARLRQALGRPLEGAHTGPEVGSAMGEMGATMGSAWSGLIRAWWELLTPSPSDRPGSRR